MTTYRFLHKLLDVISKIYIRQEYVGLENIPKDGPFILAGNHVHLYDPVIIMCSIKRDIHFLAKASLFKFPQGIVFKRMGLIKVYRDGKDHNAYEDAVKYLKNGEIIGIYPEGTRERGRGLMPFKKGAVRMSLEADCNIIPFAITGRYRPFRKGVVVKFGKPYKANKDIEKSNEELRERVRKLLEE